MTRPTKRTRATRKMVADRESRYKMRKLQENAIIDALLEEHKWEPSPEPEEPDVIPIGLMRMNADFAGSESDDSEDDEVVVSEDEEREQPDESAFERLMASAVNESRCV
jgi:hypothetical protein